MWNFLVSGLLTQAAIVLYDGNPGHPDMGVLWDLAERAGITCFGTSAAYIAACMKAGVEPGAGRDLSPPARRRLDRLPALPRGLRLDLRAPRRRHLALLDQRRHRPLHRLRRRRRRCCPSTAASSRRRALGAAVEAWDEDGNSVVDEVGELVVTEPMPSMPVYFWGDDDGCRYRASYFEHVPRASGATATGSRSPRAAPASSTAAPTRRSTASGIRMGTSEIYRAVLGRRRDRRRARRRRPPARDRGLDAALRRPRARAPSSTTS